MHGTINFQYQDDEKAEKPKSHQDPTISVILGLPFHALTMADAINECERTIQGKVPCYFVTANLDFATQASKDADLKNIIFHAERILCDGKPLVWASRFFDATLPERVTGADLVVNLLELCEQKGHSIYVFGSTSENLTKLREKLKEKYPKLRLAGTQAAPFSDNIFEWNNATYINEIKKAKPDVLLVSLGCPKQERWIYAFQKQTEVPLSIGVGGSIDFITGKQKRAPKWVGHCGIEWLWRFLHEPRRFLTRYLSNFIYLVIHTWSQYKTLEKAEKKKSSYLNHSLSKMPQYYKIVWSGDVSSATVDRIQFPPDYSRHIVCDCSGVTFLDSSGLGKLCLLSRNAKKEGVYFCVFKPSAVVKKAIITLKLDKQLPIQESPEAMLNKFKSLEEQFLLKRIELDETTIQYKPFQRLDHKTMEKLEAMAEKESESLKSGGTIVIDAEHIGYLDSMLIGKLIGIKKLLMKKGINFGLLNVTGLPLEILTTLHLKETLVYSESKDDM